LQHVAAYEGGTSNRKRNGPGTLLRRLFRTWLAGSHWKGDAAKRFLGHGELPESEECEAGESCPVRHFLKIDPTDSNNHSNHHKDDNHHHLIMMVSDGQ
jgi:hypothetical protein